MVCSVTHLRMECDVMTFIGMESEIVKLSSKIWIQSNNIAVLNLSLFIIWKNMTIEYKLPRPVWKYLILFFLCRNFAFPF